MYSHTFDLHDKFQPPRAKTLAAKEWGWTKRPTTTPAFMIELLVKAKKTLGVDEKHETIHSLWQVNFYFPLNVFKIAMNHPQGRPLHGVTYFQCLCIFGHA